MSRKSLLIIVAVVTTAALVVAGPVAAGSRGGSDGTTSNELALAPDDLSAGNGPGVDLDGPVPRDEFISDDLIVNGSACIGFDCVDGEVFGFATHVLKENNLRLFAQDTSNTALFPQRDWQIEFNNSANGGASYFMVRDCGDGATPGAGCLGSNSLTVEADAGNNAVYVASGGDVGLGTANPLTDLHIVGGNSPTVRLEQDGTGGFTPQTWDVGGNETEFFIRDVTGPPTGLLTLDTAGNLKVNGVLVTSDREAKTAFRSVDPRQMLDKVVQLDIETWKFKHERTVRHIGPAAQDWYELFGLGSTETAISQTDVNGVALASIQALAAENGELRDRVDALEAQLVQLLAALEDG